VRQASRCLIGEPKDLSNNGANGCHWILVAIPRLRAGGPVLG
jgi:hypothetical protein